MRMSSSLLPLLLLTRPQIMSANWSCILYEKNIVIHCEESDEAFQHFYPISLLQTQNNIQKLKNSVPVVSGVVSPTKTLTRRFLFPLAPRVPEHEAGVGGDAGGHHGHHHLYADPATNGIIINDTTDGTASDAQASSSASTSTLTLRDVPSTPPPPIPEEPVNPNPFPFPTWYPESAHFVRQWWPSLPGISRVSCTVVLLAMHDAITHRTRFVLAQHYFKVPLTQPALPHHLIANGEGSPARPDADGVADPEAGDAEKPISGDGALMHLWYVSTPFEVVCVLDGAEDEEDGAPLERPRPLVAVDFGHAVWIEYVENEDDRSNRPEGDLDAKWLRFVTFPSYGGDSGSFDDGGPRVGLAGDVKTLEIPDELDLDSVDTINIDQSQGAVILSVREGKIFILCYE